MLTVYSIGLFDTNSSTITSFILNKGVLAACSSETQVMTSLIPLYAAFVAALHFTVGIEVGAFIVEKIFESLRKVKYTIWITLYLHGHLIF